MHNEGAMDKLSLSLSVDLLNGSTSSLLKWRMGERSERKGVNSRRARKNEARAKLHELTTAGRQAHLGVNVSPWPTYERAIELIELIKQCATCTYVRTATREK